MADLKKSMPKQIREGFWGHWNNRRELGHRPYLGQTDQVKAQLYHHLRSVSSWDPFTQRNIFYGGIFNLEFTPDGSLLAATAENRSLLLFDPLNHALVNSVCEAHEDCVNYARFLDSRLLATCSDDTTVALWDVRYLKNKVRTLHGHSNWVKNIEYSQEAGLLVTSGFDGSIYTWDINGHAENQVQHQQVFHTEGLMRMRLTPDSSKMIICVSAGYIMVIHDLDFNHLKTDLQGFKPNVYRLMQRGTVPFAMSCNFNHLFIAARNRVELITDFPQGNDAEVISSLQVHPHGWCVLSRNTSNDERTEWTCIHDIQATRLRENAESNEGSPSSENYSRGILDSHIGTRSTDEVFPLVLEPPSIHIRFNTTVMNNQISRDSIGNLELRVSPNESSSGRQPEQQIINDPSFEPGNLTIEDTISDLRNQDPSPSNYVVIPGADQNPGSNDDESAFGGDNNPSFFLQISPSLSSRQNLRTGSGRICENSPRLMYYIEEPNVGRGYIKELCFSADGRLVCSPFGFGVRLLSFNNKCSELSNAVPAEPTDLCELSRITSHSSYVVSTKFSPTHCLLVSGCLSGKICFHQPVL